MGEKFVNYQVQCESQDDVVQAVKKITMNRSYVSPNKNGWITVYDQTSEEFHDEYIRYFVNELSAKLSTVALAFIVFGGIDFEYLLYECGKIIDEFDNDIKEETLSKQDKNNRFYGDASKLSKYCKVNTHFDSISKFLKSCRQRKREYLGQDAVYQLSPLLGIDTNRAIIGYSYFEDDRLDIEIATELEAEKFSLVCNLQRMF